MEHNGRGEIHYIDDDGIAKVEIIPMFRTLIRDREESVVHFKERITDHVLLHGQAHRRSEIVEVKWTAPLGYHQGYIDVPYRSEL